MYTLYSRSNSLQAVEFLNCNLFLILFVPSPVIEYFRARSLVNNTLTMQETVLVSVASFTSTNIGICNKYNCYKIWKHRIIESFISNIVHDTSNDCIICS